MVGILRVFTQLFYLDLCKVSEYIKIHLVASGHSLNFVRALFRKLK